MSVSGAMRQCLGVRMTDEQLTLDLDMEPASYDEEAVQRRTGSDGKRWRQLNDWYRLKVGWKIRVRWPDGFRDAVVVDCAPNPDGGGWALVRVSSGGLLDLSSIKQFQVYK